MEDDEEGDDDLDDADDLLLSDIESDLGMSSAIIISSNDLYRTFIRVKVTV